MPETPVMRKDFLVEPVQIEEARLAGASGVLLIASMLSDAKLGDMLECAFYHDMFVLLETFDSDDLARTSALLERPMHQDRAHRTDSFWSALTRAIYARSKWMPIVLRGSHRCCPPPNVLRKAACTPRRMSRTRPNWAITWRWSAAR